MRYQAAAKFVATLVAFTTITSAALAADPTWALYSSTNDAQCVVVQEKTPDQAPPSGFTKLSSNLRTRKSACEDAADDGKATATPPKICKSYSACTIACCSIEDVTLSNPPH